MKVEFVPGYQDDRRQYRAYSGSSVVFRRASEMAQETTQWKDCVEKLSVLQGRRSEWVRSWKVWKHLRNYFPVKLVKTAELSPSRNYIMGSHPTASFLAGLFRLPLYRDYVMSAGMCPVSRPSLQWLLSRSGVGNVVVIVIGGATESLSSAPGVNTVVMRQRKGFVRLALEYGADLVPVYSFGENEVFRQVLFSEGSVMRALQTTFKKVMGFAPCLFIGQSWGVLPYRVPITTVVGSPITVPQVSCPTEEMVDQYHQLYMEALSQLFHTHKTSCGLSHTHQLQII
ncbi:hypothetical protein COCON_G00072320 [Conger conger]|uniref:Acyltransferase n=1 Tax=Conger conger TaxID=82655 RepID=A0A9Q1I1V6_CONCO|nr:hypothetical protein COCON_G00072320 [Conger conger]